MTASEDGKYRWRYSVDMYRNPGVLLLLLKVFGWVFVAVAVFVLFLDGPKALLSAWKIYLGIFAGIEFLVTISYYVYALIQGGRYTWDFVMDDAGISAVQAPDELKRTKAIGKVVGAMGVLTGNATQIGVGTVVATRDGMNSSFASVGGIKADRRHNTITMREFLNHNYIYVGDDDFDFVWNFITSHCPKAKKKGM